MHCRIMCCILVEKKSHHGFLTGGCGAAEVPAVTSRLKGAGFEPGRQMGPYCVETACSPECRFPQGPLVSS